LALVVIVAVAECFVLVPVPAHAATGGITTDKSTYTTIAVEPKVIVGFNAVPELGAVYADVKSGVLFSPVRSTFAWQTSGQFDIMESKIAYPAGTYTFRLRQGDNAQDPAATSAEFTVTVTKARTTFNIGETSHVGTFYTTDSKWTKNQIYYEVKEKVTNADWAAGISSGNSIQLQRKDGSRWVKIDTGYAWDWSGSFTTASKWNIRQTTPAKTSYRLYVPTNDYVTGGTSDEFTISGKKRTPSFSLKYSTASQKYNSSKRVKLTIKTRGSSAHTGKAVVYDGKTRIGSFTVKQGKGSYKLPKKLKRGTHKISVKFTATAEFKPFYNTKTTPVKMIKVR
jgi:hypothetical protein